MIGVLPRTLEVDGKEYEIRSDFRVALLIFQVCNNPDKSDYEKIITQLKCLYKIVPDNIEEALKQAVWFLDGGDMPKPDRAPKKIMDWEQDESIIFPAVNKVAGYETRTAKYLHWWSFLGLFNEVGEGLYSQVMNIRSKQAKNKKLEKWEQEFYKSHRKLVDLKHKYSAEEQAERDRIEQLLS